MKSVLLCCALLLPLTAVGTDGHPGTAGSVVPRAAPAERQLAVLEPATVATPRPLGTPAAPADPAVESGWRERFALLGAALLALLFILRRQWTHRLGDAAPRATVVDEAFGGPRRRDVRPASQRHQGFLLSQFENLPEGATGPQAAQRQPHRPRTALRKGRRKTYWPARQRPPE